MSMILQNAIASLPSVDGGRSRLGLGFVDELDRRVVILVAGAGGQILDVEVVKFRAVRTHRLCRAFDTRDEVAQHLFCDEQGALEFDDRVGRCLEQDDVVRAFAVAVDRICQAATAPGGDLHDLAAGGDDPAGRPIDEGLTLVVRDIRADDEHEFVAAHTRETPSNGDAPLTVIRHGAERTGAESSTTPTSTPLAAMASPDRPVRFAVVSSCPIPTDRPILTERPQTVAHLRRLRARQHNPAP